jgi:AcrR family transcriptional regulator
MNRSTSPRTDSARKNYHHGDLRRALLDATLALVDQYGPQGFTLRAAARAAGVTPGATYHHFADKDALIAAVAEEGFDMFRAELQTAAEAPAASLRERSRNVGVAYVLVAMKHPTRVRVMVGYGVQRKGSISAEFQEAAKGTYRLVRDVLVGGLKTGPDDIVSDAEVLGWWSVVHGLAFLAIDGHLGHMGRSLGRVERVVQAVIEALDARGVHRPSPRKDAAGTKPRKDAAGVKK